MELKDIYALKKTLDEHGTPFEAILLHPRALTGLQRDGAGIAPFDVQVFTDDGVPLDYVAAGPLGTIKNLFERSASAYSDSHRKP